MVSKKKDLTRSPAHLNSGRQSGNTDRKEPVFSLKSSNDESKTEKKQSPVSKSSPEVVLFPQNRTKPRLSEVNSSPKTETKTKKAKTVKKPSKPKGEHTEGSRLAKDYISMYRQKYSKWPSYNEVQNAVARSGSSIGRTKIARIMQSMGKQMKKRTG